MNCTLATNIEAIRTYRLRCPRVHIETPLVDIHRQWFLLCTWYWRIRDTDWQKSYQVFEKAGRKSNHKDAIHVPVRVDRNYDSWKHVLNCLHSSPSVAVSKKEARFILFDFYLCGIFSITLCSQILNHNRHLRPIIWGSVHVFPSDRNEVCWVCEV